jgi:RND family efflux transporter MFP subunit
MTMLQRIAGWSITSWCRGTAFLALALFTLACEKKAETPQEALQAVRAGKVEMIQPDNPERYSAVITPFTQVDLSFKSSGLIESIYQVKGADGRTRNVQAGDKVIKDTVLAVVRQIDYEQRLDQARQQVSQATAQVAQAEAAMRDAELDYARAVNLYKTASMTKPDYDQAQSRNDSTKAQVQAAQSALANAKVAVSEAQLGLSDTEVRAPLTGWVIARNVECGSLVSGATIGFSLVDTAAVKAVFAVSDTSLKGVRLGQHHGVILDALPHPTSGVVTAISPQADPKSRVFSVEVTIPNPRDEIRPGMIGTIVIGPNTEIRPHLAIPLSAVIRNPEKSRGFAVFMLEERNGQFFARAREITVGETFGNSMEVTGGLAAGDSIIVLGGELLRNGQHVRVIF